MFNPSTARGLFGSSYKLSCLFRVFVFGGSFFNNFLLVIKSIAAKVLSVYFNPESKKTLIIRIKNPNWIKCVRKCESLFDNNHETLITTRSHGFADHPLPGLDQHLQQHHDKLAESWRTDGHRDLDVGMHSLRLWWKLTFWMFWTS